MATSWPFLRLYALAFLFFSANSILNVIVPLRSETLGASNTEIGFIMGVYMLTCMFCRPWAGHIVHKYGPIKVLRTLLIVNGLALMIYTVSGLEGFFAARLLQGVATAFFSMALQMGIIDSLPEKERSQGVSLYSLFTYLPTVIGPLIALGIWEWGGMNAFTIAMVGIALTTALFGYGTDMQQQQLSQLEEKDKHTGTGFITSFHQLVTNPQLSTSSLIMLMTSVVFGAVTTFIPLYANQMEHGNAGIYLMLQAGTIVLARFTLRKRIPSDGQWHPKLIVGVIILIAIAAQLLASTSILGSFVMYVAAVIMGLAQAIVYPTLMTFLTFTLTSANRNVLIGLFIAMADLGISLGGIAMGPIADRFSYSTMYTCCAGMAVGLALFAYWRGKKLRVKI
ncbi:MFS family permease [Bacillus horti]|uniref:MFS family permease n=2 Tax=Caldalkalibacillus horti TaxID=77523 RepID=A0ABT9VZ27_9BACI|nr:MFS family permease [Bacillus horti]